MTDSTGTLPETHPSSSSNEATETQLAQAGDHVQVAEPALGTTIQLVAAGDSLQLNFDPADVAKVETKDGNLEITFKNGSLAVIQGYEEWVAAGGQPTDPQGGVVDVAQLGLPAAAPAVCELPNQNVQVVDVPVPAEGERLTLAVAPGDALRLACSFRDVHGTEVGHNLEMTFPGGGVVVVENFSEWIAAKGATISDCVCGDVNPADFIVALGLNPEDVLPAGGPQGGPQGVNHPTFAPGQGPEILHSFDHPHILSPTALGYETPNPERTFLPVSENNLPDNVPTVDVPTAGAAGTMVDEKGLPARGGEPQGSGEEAAPGADGDTSETTAGVIHFTQGDAPAVVTIGGVAVTAVNQTFTGAFGTLTIDSIVPDAIGYHYTLADNTNGDNTHDDFVIVVTDKDGDAASATLVIDIVDDVPTARNDTDSTTAGHTETGNVVTGVGTTSGNAGADTPGADNALVTGIVAGNAGGTVDGGVDSAIIGSKGTLTLHADGSYAYTANPNVTGTDIFTYTLTDGDGDKSTATLTIDVGASAPVVNPASSTVNETALDLNKDGNDLAGGTTTGSNPGSTGETVQGTLSFSDPDGASVTKVTFNGTDFTDAGDGKADGIININTPLGLLAVNSTSGAYTYTLETNSLSHTTQGTGIDGVHESFTYTVADKLGNTNSNSLVINVQDDVPHANADSKNTADIVNQTVNLVIIFDRSGSMADDPNVAGYSSRLELAKAAVAALFEAYDSVTSQLHIKIVDFSTTADHSVWLSSPEEANAYLAALDADGTTNYAGANGAIPEILNNYNTLGDPVPAADRTEVYFISDGKPNPGTTTLSGSASVVTTGQWASFLTNSNVDNAYAIGVGNGLDLNDVDLGRLSFPNGNGGAEPNRIIVLDEGQLLATLVGAIPNPLFGNILTDAPADVFGADGKGNGGVGLVSIAVDGHTYTYNQATNEIRSEANVLVAAGAVLNLDTTLGGHIEFHFDTGAYEYTPPNVSSPQVENILYTIADGDGDSSSALLTINISDAGGNVVTALTHIGTNGNDNINESGAAADIIISGGVGNDTLVGGVHNDHIQGGAGNDLLVGGAGNDILIGGDGNDTLDAGTGKDFLFGGGGNDLIILRDNANFGHVDGGLAPSADLAGTNRADVLAFNGTLDLTMLANDRIVGIEAISMKDSEGGAGNDKLTINASDVIDLGTGHFDPTGSFNPNGPTNFGTLVDKDTIKVDGDSGDTLNLSGGGWFSAGAASAHGGPAGYNLYVHDAGGGNEDAYALVQTVIAVTGAS